VGPFEEEEEGTGIASNVVKVKGEIPDTPGCLRFVDTRKRRTYNDSPIRVNKTKQHTQFLGSCEVNCTSTFIGS